MRKLFLTSVAAILIGFSASALAEGGDRDGTTLGCDSAIGAAQRAACLSTVYPMLEQKPQIAAMPQQFAAAPQGAVTSTAIIDNQKLAICAMLRTEAERVQCLRT
jgi:hypothetical protein